MTVPRVSEDAVERLRHYDWPGNVRELQNVIERAVILAAGGTLRLDSWFSLTTTAGHLPVSAAADADTIITDQEWRRRERSNLVAALRHAGGRIDGNGGAAAPLCLKPSTLSSRLKSLGIQAIQ